MESSSILHLPTFIVRSQARRPTGSGRPRSEPQFAVRRSHATSCDYPQPRIGGELDGFCGMRTGLEPKDIDADRNRLARDGLGLCWRTEYIDEVDRRVDLLQGGVHVLTEHLAALRVHRDDPVSLRLEIARYDVRGLSLVRRGSHDRDRPRLLVDAQEVLA